MANSFELNLPPEAWTPDSSSPPGYGVDAQERSSWRFDADADEIVRTRAFQMPAAFAGAGTLMLDVAYYMASAVANDVRFAANVEAITPGDTLDLDSAESFDADNVQADTVPGTQGYLAVATITLSNDDGVAAGDWVRLKLRRDADDAGDTATGDCHVIGCTLREEL